MTNDVHLEGLREWAAGLSSLAAATELLIHAGFAGEHWAWVRYDEPAAMPWIAFDEIPDLIGSLSGGEQRLLQIASSLGADTPIILGDLVPGLDRKATELVMVAIAQAAGFTEPSDEAVVQGGEARVVTEPPLALWPEDRRSDLR